VPVRIKRKKGKKQSKKQLVDESLEKELQEMDE